MAEALVEPIESQLSILEPLSIVPAQSREELALFDDTGIKRSGKKVNQTAIGQYCPKHIVAGTTGRKAQPLLEGLWGAGKQIKPFWKQRI